MELNAEINKIFGQEMAKLFAQKISEEELEETARKVYKGLTNVPTDCWGSPIGKPEINKLIQKMIVDRTVDFVMKELEKPENEEVIQERAERIVKNAREIAEKEITAKIASAFVGQAISVNYADYERSEIAKSIMERLTKIEQEHGHY